MFPLVLVGLAFAAVVLVARAADAAPGLRIVRCPLPALRDQGAPLAPPTGIVFPVTSVDPRVRDIAYVDTTGAVHNNDRTGVSADRYFGAPRDGGARHHAGIDLVAHAGDGIYAMESGVVVGMATGYVGLDAIVIAHASGVVALYGELRVASGLKAGDGVSFGQRIGTATTSSAGTELHIELWEHGHAPTSFTAWPAGSPAPKGLLDPTAYLFELAQSSLEA